MKPLLFLPFLLLGLLAGQAAPPTGSITFFWDYPSAYLETNLVFRLYTSTNITTPLTNWTVIGSVNGLAALGTNGIGTNTSKLRLSVKIEPGQHYFVMKASNFWGEADFSNVVSTPALPRDDSTLRVERWE